MTTRLIFAKFLGGFRVFMAKLNKQSSIALLKA